MRLVLNTFKLSKYATLCISFGLLFLASGCEELNTTVDTVLLHAKHSLLTAAAAAAAPSGQVEN